MPPVDPARWSEIEAWFDRALDRDPATREAWVRDQCADDPDLRDAVLSLLSSEAASQDDLAIPAPVEAARVVLDGLHDPLQGKSLGPYRLGEEIGRGGMGVVYRAQRQDGQFQQGVVIKILRAGIDDAEGQHRFLRERQILANLTHAHIAHLLDGGVAPDGRPFIVMEPVDGIRIDLWCDRARATVRQRVELFLQVVDAVDHAHRNLIVHRDLKPSNILVTADGQAKLLDFGIAKMLDAPEEPGHTLTRQPLMTPEYASPEQVRAEPITTASDVYQLGVLLYELLTGRLPYPVAGRSGFDVSQAICETEPDLPSRIGTRGANPDPGVFDARRATPARLRRALGGDLDRILLKALRKEPAERYPSVRELGQDLRRHLDGDPISVRADSAGYRLGRFVRRHRAPIVGIAAVLVALVGFGAFHTARVTAERDRAQREAAQKQEIAEFLVEMFETTDDFQTAGGEVTGTELVERAVARIESGAYSKEVSARMLLEVAHVAANLGLSDRALGLYRDAEVRISDVFGSRSRRALQARFHYATHLAVLRQFDASRPLLEEGVTLARDIAPDLLPWGLRELATVQRETGEVNAAGANIREALTMMEAGGDASPEMVANSRSTLAFVLRAQGEVEEAERLYREVLVTQRELNDPLNLATTLNNLGYLCKAQSRIEEAVALYREAYQLRTAHSGPAHPVTRAFRGNLVGALCDAGLFPEAFEHAIALRDLAIEHHGPDDWRTGAAQLSLAHTHLWSGNPDAAESHVLAAVETWDTALGPDHAWAARARLELAQVLEFQGETDRARRLWSEHLPTALAGLDNSAVRNTFQWMARMYREYGREDRAVEIETLVEESLAQLSQDPD